MKIDSFVQSKGDGVVLTIAAVPRSKRIGFLGVSHRGIKIGINSAPDKGKANDELVRWLADQFSVTRSEIEILNGHGTSAKTIWLKRVDRSAVENQIERWSARIDD